VILASLLIPIRWTLALGLRSSCRDDGIPLTLGITAVECRVLIGLGRDAADVPITMAFGKQSLEVLRVLTEEIVDFAAVADALIVKAA
jgi:hypothetical protein